MHKEIAFAQIFDNPVLFTGLVAWAMAQFLKVPIDYLRFRRVNWGMFFSAGGMPSSHSALVSSISLAIGLYYGFQSPVFALSFAIAMIVIYDATGVRREAGRHAEKINILINELFAGHPISDKQLKEVIGHTPAQVTAGTALGICTALLIYYL